MTTGGEGGMVTTNDRALWSKMWAYKDHGKSWEAVYERQHPPGFRWVHDSFGTNWRMIEIQAAIGRIQLRKIADWTQKRQANSAQINKAASRYGCIRLPSVPDHISHAAYKHYVFIKPDQLIEGWTRDRIVHSIVEMGVPCYQGSCSEVYLERAFDGTNYRPAQRLPNARELGETSLMFLVHPTLTASELAVTIDALSKTLSKAARPT